jgi:hypothetical protein
LVSSVNDLMDDPNIVMVQDVVTEPLVQRMHDLLAFNELMRVSFISMCVLHNGSPLTLLDLIIEPDEWDVISADLSELTGLKRFEMIGRFCPCRVLVAHCLQE